MHPPLKLPEQYKILPFVIHFLQLRDVTLSLPSPHDVTTRTLRLVLMVVGQHRRVFTPHSLSHVRKSKYNSVHPAIQRREFSLGQFYKELDDKPVGSRSSKNEILNIIKSLRCATVHLRPLSMLLHGVQSTYDVRIR